MSVYRKRGASARRRPTRVMKYEWSLGVKATVGGGGMTVENPEPKRLIDELIVKSKWSRDVETLSLQINPPGLIRAILPQSEGGESPR